MNAFALDTVRELMDKEMGALAKIMVSPSDELSEETLLGIHWKELISKVNKATPTTWTLLHHAAGGSMDTRQKNAEMSCGLATKALDTLHALGISMSQKWSYDGIEALSVHAHCNMTQDIAQYPWFGIHDNVNIPFRIYQQRLDNQSHFDSGTAGTIVIITDPSCTPPCFMDLKLSLMEGYKNPITLFDILELEQASSHRFKALATHIVLSVLIDAPDFGFDKYKHKASSVFTRPRSGYELQASKEMATRQYMLDLLHIEESSYEGNDKVLGEWFRMTRVDPTSQQLLVWYYGTCAGHGLVHTFDLLKCKGLHAPSVQVAGVESLQELRELALEALQGLASWIVLEFASQDTLDLATCRSKEDRDDVLSQAILWNKDILDYIALNSAISWGDIGFNGGMNSKYAIEVLELIQCLHRDWPDDLHKFVVCYCWLANMTGRDDCFLPIDLLQEHNIRDIKHTFTSIGPFATWEYIRKTSMSIPCQRCVKDHVEREVNHFA
ncbi:hypothetical protein BC827DRAFT_1153743 [Russula dissimulans]|nr:hypothetical protein BC827DRAFT_1153743 [Russula dissimulans]